MSRRPSLADAFRQPDGKGIIQIEEKAGLTIAAALPNVKGHVGQREIAAFSWLQY